MKSVYFIPTNQSVFNCLNSYIKEIKYAREKYGKTIPLLVMETHKNQVAKKNTDIIKAVQQKYPEDRIIHVTKDFQIRYFNTLLQGINNRVKQVFLSSEKNYGNMMNKMFLLTASIGAKVIHRRDADTRLVPSSNTAENARLPIEVELNCIGKKVGCLTNINGVPSNGSYDLDKQVHVVGGNYQGEWNLDLKDFARNSMDFVYDLYRHIGFSEQAITSLCKNAYQFEQTTETVDRLTLVSSFEGSHYPDCGNLAIYKLHEYYPALPGKNTLSADYFPIDTACALGLPFIHHNREVFHEYHDGRYDFKSKLNYWNGMIKFADYFRIYKDLYDDTDFFSDGCFQGKRSEDYLRQRMLQLFDRVCFSAEACRKHHLELIINRVLKGFDDNYIKIGQALQSDLNNIVVESNSDFLLHSQLFEIWDMLIARAKQIDLMDFISHT